MIDGQWVSEALPGQRPEVAGPRCYSGYPYGAAGPDGGRPLHQPGGTAPCSTCYARTWRERCRAAAQRATELRARAAQVRPGTTVRFATPLTFGNAEEHQIFVFEKGSVFRVDGSPHRYRIRRWRDHDYTVLPTQEPTAPQAPAASNPGTLSRQARAGGPRTDQPRPAGRRMCATHRHHHRVRGPQHRHF